MQTINLKFFLRIKYRKPCVLLKEEQREFASFEPLYEGGMASRHVESSVRIFLRRIDRWQKKTCEIITYVKLN